MKIRLYLPVQTVRKKSRRRGTALCGWLIWLACLVLPVSAGAGSGRQRILIIKTRDIPFYTPMVQGFTNGLKTRGYRSGDKTEIATIALTGNADADAKLFHDQLAKKPDLLVTLGTDASRLAFDAKPGVPTLFGMVLDPVNLGVVHSLEEPGDNFTGTTLLVSPGKQLDTLLQAVPSVRRVGVLYTDKDPTSLAFLEEARQGAARLHIEIAAIAVSAGQSAKDALAGLKDRADAVWLIPDPASTSTQALTDTFAFARANRLPVLGASGGTVKMGALLALSASAEDLGDITAEMAVHLLDGTETAAKMRVRAPRRTMLTVNLDAARALKIKIPDTMLHLADEVVDEQKDGNDQ